MVSEYEGEGGEEEVKREDVKHEEEVGDPSLQRWGRDWFCEIRTRGAKRIAPPPLKGWATLVFMFHLLCFRAHTFTKIRQTYRMVMKTKIVRTKSSA